jgi:hypothetical protein
LSFFTYRQPTGSNLALGPRPNDLSMGNPTGSTDILFSPKATMAEGRPAGV